MCQLCKKRTVFVFDCEHSQGSAAVNMGLLPLMVDSTGVYCRPEGNVFISGCTPKEDLDVDFNDFTRIILNLMISSGLLWLTDQVILKQLR